MASTASKFLFEVDFGAGASPAERPVAAADHAAMLADAEARGFKDGYAAAEKDQAAEAARRTAAAFEHIGDGLDQLVRGIGTIERRLEADAVAVAVAVGRKLAPSLLAREPFAEIAELAADCFRQLATTPHIVVRINETQHQTAREKLEHLARTHGFEGRLVVMAEPDIAVGDCRIEWADGGLVRDQTKTDAAIGQTVNNYIAARTPTVPPDLGEISI
jgi:flagellar assembly protein FliH